MNKSLGYTLLLTTSLLFGGASANKKSSSKVMASVNSNHNLYTNPNCDDFVKTVTSSSKKPTASLSKAKILSSAWSDVISETGHRGKISEEFFQKVINFAKSVKIDPVDFSFIIFQESKFNPMCKNGSYAGLIQMDETAFKKCALRMLQYEQYCKNNPKKNLTLVQFNNKIENKKLSIPDIGKKNILFSTYSGLSRERQFEYASAYLRYRIHEQGLNGKKITSNQLWALIHRPFHCKKSDELINRSQFLSAVKIGGTVDVNGRNVVIKGVKQISPDNYKKIISCVK